RADAPAGKFQKLQILSVSPTEWTFRYGKPDDPEGTTVTLTKDPRYAQTLFSFDDGLISFVEPPLEQWHLLFTRYTYDFSKAENAGPDYKFYSVTGALLNHFWGVKAAKLTPQTPGYVPFDSLKSQDVEKFVLSEGRDVVGYDWKEYSLQTALYQVVPDVYYLIRTPDDEYYKLRFTSFYNASGRRGVPQFEYRRL
ncbi:MAG: HmuY family protein, partial [Bacteroidia bacterium]|nr:HmuY family protein [Bacteroidia bacterium]